MSNQNSQFISTILDENNSFDEIKNAIQKIYTEYFQLTTITGKHEAQVHGTFLESGEALTAPSAAGCVFDYVRTTKFLRGVKTAIDAQLELNPVVKILYAGTGPFASLLLPLLPLYDSNQLNITFIDYHTDSVNALNSLIDQKGWGEFVTEIVKGDATQFETSENFNIILSETMRNALRIEPQVAITLHLSKFLAHDGCFIPQEINIDAYVTNVQKELSSSKFKLKNFWFKIQQANARLSRIFVGRVMSLTGNSYIEYEIDKNPFPLTKLTFPKSLKKKKDVIFTTEIKIFDDIILSEEDPGGLTRFLFNKNIPELQGGENIQFSYLLGKEPQIVHEKIF